MVQLFVDGGNFMWPILGIFIIGLAFVGERLYHLISGLGTDERFANLLANEIHSSSLELHTSQIKYGLPLIIPYPLCSEFYLSDSDPPKRRQTHCGVGVLNDANQVVEPHPASRSLE